MTPSPEAVAALGGALSELDYCWEDFDFHFPGGFSDVATPVLAALPEGWALVDMEALVERVAEGLPSYVEGYPGNDETWRAEARRLLAP